MDPKILRDAALAYEAVYNQEMRQEVEEQKDFENWVNSLVEEGYDLSEYTWEEMYEEYLSEAPNLGTGGTAQDMINRRQATLRRTGGTLGAGGGQAAMRNLQSRGVDPRSAYARVYAQGERNLAASSRPSSARPAAAPAATRPSGGSRPAPAPSPAAARSSGGSRPAPAARPAASAPTAKPSPTPSASAPAKPTPAPSTPAAKPSAMDQWAKANPRLAQAQQIRKQGGSRAEVNKALYNKGTAAATSTPTVVKAGFDMFDVVKGYLIDEGYAETEQAAIAIMANMSEGWKSEIIDEAVKGESSERRRALAAERRKGIKPLSAKEGEKYASHKISQMAYTKRAKMGDDD